jgi:hypothetical protein
MMAAIGAMVLCALAGCAVQPDVTPVSAMVRSDDARPDVSRLRVTVDLSEIVTP